ncbi:MAG: transglutaminase domain-containing protein [Roseburia sp.]
MKKLKFRYHLRIEFDTPVTGHSFTVRCMPQTDDRQQILSQDIRILPKEFLSENTDSFGNSYFFGRTEAPHDLFEVKTEGTVVTGRCEGIAAEPVYRLGMFVGQSKYTQASEELRRFYRGLALDDREGNLAKALRLMEALREHFSYAAGVTDISTTAAQAWELGRGVCQDYSHIMLSLCRMAHIQSRYVVGMLLGEGASHAWVEIYDNGMWYGIDPTNGIRVLEDHIKISHGRDYADCLINQGVFTGNAKQVHSVSVLVEE